MSPIDRKGRLVSLVDWMRTAVLGLAVVAVLHAPARADGDVGVIVAGEGSIQPQLADQIANWLSRHGHRLVPSPLPPDAVTALIDCVVLADRSCARDIVEKRAKSSRMVFAQVDAASGGRDVTLTAYWFDRGHDAVAERKTCQRCTAQSLRITADEMMRKLVGSSDGQVKLKSSPPGARIVIDGQAIGVTPLDWDLPRGNHTIAMDKPGFAAASRDIVVVTEQSQIVALELQPVEHGESGTWLRPASLALMIGGASAIVAGGVLFKIDEDPSPSEGEFIRDTAPLGVALGAGGVVVGAVGAYLFWFRSPRTSAPVAAITSDSAYVGWHGRF
jgi:hypothetical protein